MLEQIFGSRTRVKLLRLFLLNPDSKFFVREITRLVGEQINSIRRELTNLENIGLIKFIEKNQKKYFYLDNSNILYPELKALILKAQITLEKSLVKAIKDIGQVKYLLLSGLFVGNEEIPTDILMVGRVNRTKISSLVKKFQGAFSREINYTIMSPTEFIYRKDITDKFLYQILDNKKIVVIDKFNTEEEKNK